MRPTEYSRHRCRSRSSGKLTPHQRALRVWAAVVHHSFEGRFLQAVAKVDEALESKTVTAAWLMDSLIKTAEWLDAPLLSAAELKQIRDTVPSEVQRSIDFVLAPGRDAGAADFVRLMVALWLAMENGRRRQGVKT